MTMILLSSGSSYSIRVMKDAKKFKKAQNLLVRFFIWVKLQRNLLLLFVAWLNLKIYGVLVYFQKLTPPFWNLSTFWDIFSLDGFPYFTNKEYNKLCIKNLWHLFNLYGEVAPKYDFIPALYCISPKNIATLHLMAPNKRRWPWTIRRPEKWRQP